MSDYRRQHPLMVLMDSGRGLISNISVAFLISVSIPNDALGGFGITFALVLLAMIGITAAYNTAKWAFFYYRYDSGMVHIKQGIVFKRERTIKRERVQSINVNSNLVQQAFGLFTVQIKTAGVSTDAEINLRALSRDEVQNIRDHLNRNEAVEEGMPVEVAKATRFLQGRDLWLAGITSGRFVILFSVVTLVFSQVFEYIPPEYLDYAVDRLIQLPLLLAIGIVGGLLLVSWGLSAVVFVIQFTNFTVRRFEDRLEISWGVLKRNHVTVGLHRLQALVVQQGLLRQPFGLCTVLIEVAGGGAKEKEKVSILHPLLRKCELESFLNDILPEYHLPGSLQPLPRRSLRRYLFRTTVPTAAIIAVIILLSLLWELPYSWASLLLFIPAVLLGISRHSTARTSVEEGQISLRFRNLSLIHVLVGRGHIQSLSLLANPFQRLGRLRTVSVSLLSSPAGKSFLLRDVDSETAKTIWRWYSRGPNTP